MNRETHEVYQFDGFRLDRRRRVLSRLDGEAIPLKSKVFDTLLYFVEHPDELLDKSTLIKAIWPNLVVEENNLNKTISVLRHVLGETPEEHRYIVTEPGRGYRFVAKVSSSKAEARPDALPLPAAPDAVSDRWKMLFPIVTGLLAAAVVLLVVANYTSRGTAIRPQATRFHIDSLRTLNPLNMALSPDGRQIAYVGEGELGISIWVRPLDSLEARALPGTEGGGAETDYPFWSPDSRSIAFRSGRQLKRSDLAGAGTSTIVDNAPWFRRGTWGSDGTILFASGDSGAAVIRRVSASGGESVAVTELDASLGEITHAGPSFLPDGRHFLFKAMNADRRDGTIYIGSLDANERPIRLLKASKAKYVEPGFLLYTREQTLFAHAFDPRSLELKGEAVQIAGDVLYLEALDTSVFDASAGTLIFRQAEEEGPDVSLQWVDRSGTTTDAGLAIAAVDFRLSPDAKRIVFSEGNPPGIWTLDIERGTRTRVTANPQVNHNAIWSPDGSSVAFDWHADGNLTIYEKRADGADPGRTLLEAGAYDVIVTDWSDDGRFIVFEKDKCVACFDDIWVLPMSGGGEPFVYAETNSNEQSAVLSPDGRWLAYMTSESGIYEVVVQSFPDAAQNKWQISANGGAAPRWARDGKELYYYDVTGSIVRVQISTDPVFEVGEAVRVAAASGAYQWDVTADGERILTRAPVVTESAALASRADTFAITVILNWTALLPN